MNSKKLNPHIEAYLAMIESGKIAVSKEQIALAAYVRNRFEIDDIYTDDEQLEKYLGLSKYFAFERLFEWEAFCIALHLCTFWRESGEPRWPDLLLLIGRGAGKDGYIALESMCVTSPYSKLPQYDVDICANAEEQAMRPVKDVIDALENTRHRTKMKKHYYWTQEKVVGLKYKGIIRGRTNNPKSKDGMRSGLVVFNEIHQYQNFNLIKVFSTGLGKKKHPRRTMATTDGDVREGPIDEYKAQGEAILAGDIDDNGLLPFICRLDDKNEVDNPEMWVKANPSLIYLPTLRKVMEKEYEEWKRNPETNLDFMTKRMNLPQSSVDVAVTSRENIVATNREMPDLTGQPCVVGVDYASNGDLVSVNAHFRIGEIRYDINHSWLCLQSKTLSRLTIPWREWAAAGHLTLVDEVEIHPDLPCEWIFEQAKKYEIRGLALDNYRYALFRNSLKNIGFDTENYGRLKLVRPSDIMKVQPVIESCFNNQNFVWGDNPPLRWATNNTKLVRSSRNVGVDTGNFIYAKIEAKTRKTDPFMALVAAMVIEEVLGAEQTIIDDIPVIIV